MSARVRMAAALVVALSALAGMVLLVVHIRSDENDTGRLGFAATSPAGAPFGEFTQTHVAVGSRCLHVLVALSPTERNQGLREVTSIAPYDGMLFVTPGDTNEQFTMADTVMPLAITFFSARGVPLDDQQMTPCPHGSDATCPAYVSKKAYRYALERPAGAASASGALGACG